MAYTLGEAAKATGKSKATLSKAIKSGRISATKGDTGAFHPRTPRILALSESCRPVLKLHRNG
jgi:hypothetical protein